MNTQSLRATLFAVRLEITQVNPGIGPVLQPLCHHQRLVMRSFVHFKRILVQDAGPYNCLASFGHDGLAYPHKIGPTTFRDIIQVHEHCQDSRPLWPLPFCGYIVMAVQRWSNIDEKLQNFTLGR